MLTAPRHQATNGQAEKFLKIFVKSILANIKANPRRAVERTAWPFLIEYRNTTHCATRKLPSKVFFGRSLRTCFTNLICPTTKRKSKEQTSKYLKYFKGKRNIEFMVNKCLFGTTNIPTNLAGWKRLLNNSLDLLVASLDIKSQ